MQQSLRIARLLGPIMCAIGIGMLTNGPAYRTIATQFISGYPFIYFSGVLLMATGLAILNSHDGWTRDWRSAITVLGWFFTAAGAFRLIAPPFVAFIGGNLFAKSEFFLCAGIIFLVIGAFFTFKGYVA